MTEGEVIPSGQHAGHNGDLARMQSQMTHVMEENELLLKTVSSGLPRHAIRPCKTALCRSDFSCYLRHLGFFGLPVTRLRASSGLHVGEISGTHGMPLHADREELPGGHQRLPLPARAPISRVAVLSLGAALCEPDGDAAQLLEDTKEPGEPPDALHPRLCRGEWPALPQVWLLQTDTVLSWIASGLVQKQFLVLCVFTAAVTQ